jgi:hypothetical protein
MEFTGKPMFNNVGLSSLLFNQIPVRWEEDILAEKKKKWEEENPEEAQRLRDVAETPELFPEDERSNFTVKLAIHFGYNGNKYAGSQM